MAVKAELQQMVNGAFITRSIDGSRLVLTEDVRGEGILRCQGDPDLEGRKGRTVRKIILSRHGHAQLQVGPNSAVVILPVKP